MKSSLIEKNFDLTLDISGETWSQGQEIKGVLKLTNKSSQIQKPELQKILIAYVEIKKFKALEEKSFQIISTIDLGELSLKANETINLPWNYLLDENAYITDKKRSLYVLWGDLSKKIPASMMLNILPYATLQKILEVWEIFFRFTKKEITSLKDQSLEIKLTPPQTKEYATLEFLKVLLKRNKGDLNLAITANIQSIAADTTGMKLAKSIRSHETSWKEKNFQLMPGHLNQEFVQNQINAILSSVMNKK